jgi:hypothetical protein
MRAFLLVLVLAFAADDPRPAALAAAGEKELKVFAKAPVRPGNRGAGNLVIRGGQELAKLMGGVGANIDDANARMAKILKVDKIDWNKQMLLVIGGGKQRSGGYRVEVTGLKVKGDTLTVHWKLVGPRRGQPVTKAITYPALTLLVERFDDTIRFDPPEAKSGVE